MGSVLLGECIEEYLEYLRCIKCRSVHTIAGYGEDLKHFARQIGIETPMQAVTELQLRNCIGELSRQKYSTASINRFISSLRGLFAYCKKNHYILDDVAIELKSLKLAKHLPRFMTQTEIDRLCNEPDEKNLLWAARDKAIFEMLYSSGCRVAELASLKFQDFTKDYKSAVVKGKGNKERYVFFESDAVKALKAYLAERDLKFPAQSSKGACYVDHIFINQQGTPLKEGGIRFIVGKYSGIEGVNNPVTPHSFRHTFATGMLLNGADVRMVQEMLGHSSINATQRYTHVSKEHLKDIYNQAFPHSGKKD